MKTLLPAEKEMNVNAENYVCQSNELIVSRQSLSLNSAKLLRTAIMQVVRDDKELKPYIISIIDMAKLFNIPTSNVYRDIDKITNELMTSFFQIKKITRRKEAWTKIALVTKCEYDSDIGISIKLNPDLEPYILNLQEKYTQYRLENILGMKSTYAIRIFELIQEKIKLKRIPRTGTNVELSLQEIREGCDCLDKYQTFGNLKARVIDIAVKEINRVTMYHVDYTYRKTGRTITGLVFHVQMIYNRHTPK